ncbi:uncharacterized protein PV06_01508 [Exophiala oligosperma]|uniref:OsmC-like protein n=2 Tax=Chaetothyriales TaxID=34395 RepID=A0A0D2CGG3_9EURO|nr:uncharacterized protein PV06_01508 [Exophiala oligosperma]KAJ9626682.1 hypothetical protein H2204_009952 [Knufia peltigerae]KIW48952.1 hypothetical protein PV06_01508 [Exophiala oligosperma]
MVVLNGFNTDSIGPFAESAKINPQVTFKVATKWTGQAKSTSHVSGHNIFGKDRKRDFDILADEPLELLGENTAPNPQDLLMAGLNSCMVVGYAVNAAAMGIKLENLEIVCQGDLNLRGFLALDGTTKAGYNEVEYTVRIKADAPSEKLEELHLHVQKTSPNFSNFATPIKLVPKLVVESGGSRL